MVDGTNEVAEQQEDFDYESIVLRRADPDDFDEIINLVEIGEDDIYNRVYSFPNVLKLIETAYLAITVIDRDGRVVAFAAFEDYPSVSSRALRRHFCGHSKFDQANQLLCGLQAHCGTQAGLLYAFWRCVRI